MIDLGEARTAEPEGDESGRLAFPRDRRSAPPVHQRRVAVPGELTCTAFNDARVASLAPVVVTTPPGIWHYAWGVDLRALQATLGIGPDAAVEVTVQVEVSVGRLGVLAVADDLQAVVGRQLDVPASGAEQQVTLTLREPGIPRWLVFRNHSPAGATTFSVRELEVTWGDPVAISTRARVRDLDGARDADGIDLGRIGAIAEQALDEGGAALHDPARFLDVLRRKWAEVPAGLMGRANTAELLALPDGDLMAFWAERHREATTGPGFSVRGWYQALYRDVLRGTRVLDVGSGMGLDGVFFARNGAAMTFVDIEPTNLRVIERLCRASGVTDAAFLHLTRLEDLRRLSGEFDVVWCQGSMINAPFRVMQRECALLLEYLRIGGRWIELAYPRERWVREGSLPFSSWGGRTDGPGTPWVEWYDLEKLARRLAPATFDVVLASNFHDDDFNWFELRRRT